MKFECPSCFMYWSDHRLPKDEFHSILCIFCAKSHNEKDLIDWQIQHINNIETEKLKYVMRNLYKYFTLQISLLDERINEHNRPTKETESQTPSS